jgi:gamma-glutamylcysteine synthetase
VSETQFLDPLLNMLENQETSADELLRKFNGVWEKDISKIFTINN